MKTMDPMRPVFFVKIDQKIFVSSFIRSVNLEFLKSLGVKTVINLTGSLGRPNEKAFKGSGINYVTINLDLPYEKKYEEILRNIRGCTVIHCGAGRTSSVVAVAYLAAKGVPVQKAIETVNAKIGLSLDLWPQDIALFKRLREISLERKRKAPMVRAAEKRVVRLKRGSVRG